MSTQSKLVRLLLGVTAAFVVGVFALWWMPQGTRDSLQRDMERDKSEAFDRLLDLEGRSLEVLAYDYSYWDDMVSFVSSADPEWARTNLADEVLATYRANATWVYGPDRRLVYAHDNVDSLKLGSLPLPDVAFQRLFASKHFCHFFLDTPAGLLELRGATIHPSADSQRVTPAAGYLFAGRLWTPEYMRQVSQLADGKVVRVALGPGKTPVFRTRKSQDGVVAFTKILTGWAGDPVARLSIHSESDVVRGLSRMANLAFLLLVGVATVLFLSLFLAILRWVQAPLKLLSRSLSTEDPSPVASLLEKRGEFGDMSRLIRRFFEQRDSLFREIAERKRAEAQLIHDAFHDGLTGLPNRALFTNRLENAIERGRRRQGETFAVLFVDLDRFKVVNDSLGHQAGDEVLRATAHRLTACMRAGDTVSRLGGDEFAILIEELTRMEDAQEFGGRILRELARPFPVNGREIVLTASIGIAANRGHDDAAEVLRDSDLAMYRAKALGKARYVFFDPAMRDAADESVDLEIDLQRALERGEMCVYYQPLVSLEDGSTRGFEALVRWEHPKLGVISPERFIPLAEEAGTVLAIDLWVLDQACRQLRAWHVLQGDDALYVSVNLSSKQLVQPDLVLDVARILEASALPPRCLKLEITESLMMQNPAAAAETLAGLAGLGIELCLDDFGTGHSSLSYLQCFPVRTLKIDRSFAQKICEPESFEIVRAIVAMSHSLGMEVVAEGLEVPEQVERFRGLGCRSGQGYLFSKPVASEVAQRWLTGGEEPGEAERAQVRPAGSAEAAADARRVA